MSWFTDFLTSSLGRKLVMSLTGLFLIIFLVIHLTGNLQLLLDDGGRQFNLYAKFMTTNPLIQAVSILLYASILVHTIQGWALWAQNRRARGGAGYAMKATKATQTSALAAKSMGWLGTVIFVFILIHLYQFWLQMKLGNLPMANYDGVEVKDLYTIVTKAFRSPGFVVFYVASMAIIGYHLYHGFYSAFQTLGLQHRKYTPLIRWVGRIYSIAVPLGFASIPVYLYGKASGWW